jgi:hypothetical protein
VSVTGCSWFLEKERERNKDPIFSLFLGVFQIDLRHYDGNIWNARILFFFRRNLSRTDLWRGCTISVIFGVKIFPFRQ